MSSMRIFFVHYGMALLFLCSNSTVEKKQQQRGGNDKKFITLFYHFFTVLFFKSFLFSLLYMHYVLYVCQSLLYFGNISILCSIFLLLTLMNKILNLNQTRGRKRKTLFVVHFFSKYFTVIKVHGLDCALHCLESVDGNGSDIILRNTIV